jgi:hypothetical protein
MRLDFDLPRNGQFRKATVTVFDDAGDVKTTDKVDMVSMLDRGRFIKRLAKLLDKPLAEIAAKVESDWSRIATSAAATPTGVALAAPEVEILDSSPDVIRRPLCLAGQHAYAAAWLSVQRTISHEVDQATGQLRTLQPPKVVRTSSLAIIRSDGRVFSDGGVPGATPLGELDFDVKLPFEPPPSRCWSGAGVKRFVAGERPDVVNAFNRIVAVVDHFMDFNRSLASQQIVCEMVACYTLASYLLDASNVAGYLWSNGDRGTGKSNLLFVMCEMAYLGQVILAGGSYASLRDLADYGATLAFDDAEGVMDAKRYDPDKRALLLAGNRRGATVTVKEPTADKTWRTRHIDTFCPRMFSAIRLPDEVLGSRSIIVPLVRSTDPVRAKRQPLDHTTWPHSRRCLLDDLWAIGLSSLPELCRHDAEAARKARLSGRDLEPWRSILAVAHWLSQAHGYTGLFERMEELSVKYQGERGELDAHNPVRVLIRAMNKMLGDGQELTFAPKELATTMNEIAVADDMVDDGKGFTSARSVGWLLKRLRFRRAGRSERAKGWAVDRSELGALALAYGVQCGEMGTGAAPNVRV